MKKQKPVNQETNETMGHFIYFKDRSEPMMGAFLQRMHQGSINPIVGWKTVNPKDPVNKTKVFGNKTSTEFSDKIFRLNFEVKTNLYTSVLSKSDESTGGKPVIPFCFVIQMNYGEKGRVHRDAAIHQVVEICKTLKIPHSFHHELCDKAYFYWRINEPPEEAEWVELQRRFETAFSSGFKISLHDWLPLPGLLQWEGIWPFKTKLVLVENEPVYSIEYLKSCLP